MATYVQRLTMIVEGALGVAPTAGQLTRLGEAIGATVASMGVPYAEMTNAQKAEFAVKHIRRLLVGIVKTADANAAAVAASDAAAAVEVEFAEAP